MNKYEFNCSVGEREAWWTCYTAECYYSITIKEDGRFRVSYMDKSNMYDSENYLYICETFAEAKRKCDALINERKPILRTDIGDA